MKRDTKKLLVRILLVVVVCVWKPLHLPHLLASFLGTAACFLLLYDILRSFLIVLDIYINS